MLQLSRETSGVFTGLMLASRDPVGLNYFGRLRLLRLSVGVMILSSAYLSLTGN
jgi:hypothetical protein